MRRFMQVDAVGSRESACSGVWDVWRKRRTVGNPRKTAGGGESRDHCQRHTREKGGADSECARARGSDRRKQRNHAATATRGDAEAGSSCACSLRAHTVSGEDLLDVKGRV